MTHEERVETGAYNTDNLVDIHSILKQLKQQIEQAEWNGEPCEHLISEYNNIVKYHMQTGSQFYPLF
jgi:hypothetical protein